MRLQKHEVLTQSRQRQAPFCDLNTLWPGEKVVKLKHFLKIGPRVDPKYFSLNRWMLIFLFQFSGLSSHWQATVLIFFLRKQIGGHVFFLSKIPPASRLQDIHFYTPGTKIVFETSFLELWHLKIWDILPTMSPTAML